MDELLTFPHLEGVLNDYGVAVRNLYQDKLIVENKIATGDLLNHLEFEVKQDGAIYSVVLELEKYWKYVEYGRRPGGKFPPRQAILDWIKVKPVIPRPMSNGKLPTDKQLAFLISRSIAENGIKPTNALEKSNEQINKEYADKIVSAFMEDIQGRLHTMLQFLITE